MLWDILAGRLPLFKSHDCGRVKQPKNAKGIEATLRAAAVTDEAMFSRECGPVIQDPVTPINFQAKSKAATTTLPTGRVTIGAVATRIVGGNPSRDGVMIKNTSTSTSLFVGGSTVTSLSGHEVDAGEIVTIPTVEEIYGVVASGSVDVTFLEVNNEG